MKITDIKTRFINQFMFVQVYTDAGLVGLGESGAWAFLEASASAVETFKRYLIGQDPLRIEHHWQYMYRCYHFRGAAIMGALSAIDIALWDIAGKYYGVPCYKLMGGPTREKARVYYHVFGNTREKLIEGCIDAKLKGFTAVGHLTPFTDSKREERWKNRSFAAKIEDAIESVFKYREAVGNEVDLCIEIHRQFSVPEAITLGRGIEPCHPMFYEDPVRPDNFDEMAKVASAIGIPIATGERIHTLQEFGMLLSRNACCYIRPDVCMCGGLTHAKKIAAIAEAYGVLVVPHNPLSPVSTAACMQLAASIPNFAILEYPIGEDKPPKSKIVKSTLQLENGFLIVPNTPGIGIELEEDAEERYPYVPREYVTKLHEDGSVMDQ
ncbi:MAG: mandelate racemase/muconate lactonizing enzyme family protein [Bacillota bacterium]